MASGRTTTGSLGDSLDTVVMSARTTREVGGVMQQCVDRITLEKNKGLDWKEVLLAQMNAQAIQETTVLDNPQQYSDTAITVTPTKIGIETFVSDRTKDRVNKKTLAKMGKVPQEGVERKKNADGLTQIDSFSSSYCGAGSTLTTGHLTAAVATVQTGASSSSGTGEPAPLPINIVLHSYQIKDIEDELMAGVGTYAIPEGLTSSVLRSRFKGTISGARVYNDDNITIDSSDDAKGGVFSKKAIVLVQGASPKVYHKFRPEIGGGGESLYLYDEYAYGERLDSWGVEIASDAATPTS